MNKELIGLVTLWIGFFSFGCTYIKEKTYKILDDPDNIIEEIVEEVIESQTGLDIDLTPMSAE